MSFSKKAKALVIAGLIAVSSATPAHAADLQGSGASFVDPLLQACKAGFAKATSHSYVYTSTGSGTGKKNSDSNIGDFWFSDSAHTAATKRSTVYHAPIIAAPVAVLVNLPAKKDVYLSATTVAKIFSGEITKWNDPAIVADNNRSVSVTVYKKDAQGNAVKDKSGNPVVLRSTSKSVIYTLPNQPIKVIYRADGSGTSNNFTKWLNGVAPSVWTKPANDAFTTAFPGNINSTGNIGRIVGANASQGVATLAAKTKYSITYAEKNWGDAYGLRAASIGNASGNFIYPESGAVSAFLGEATQDANGIVSYNYGTKLAGAYTLGIVSYMLLETEYKDKARGAAVKQLAEYILSPACSAVDPKLGYVVLSGAYLDKAKALIAKANK
ncbi:phosphate transport system substrate-binding protein [Candidatus Planktophila sulfonica]|uniref:Phosphate-binding protein n=1 Tax=Candidatus Planktophila sulfonica TaxID=1884904 RepID=A0A249KHE2_9ACTN|nr:substrate-binding domain-containing protein [Candidatus Planktophila sulfonica]ASY16211.1 phosphate transport system substrate-binding protein [Candidatus Planktophila sulfonica]